MTLKEFKKQVNILSFDSLKEIAVDYQAEFDPYGEKYEYANKREIVHDMTEYCKVCIRCIDSKIGCHLCPVERNWLKNTVMDERLREVKELLNSIRQ